MTSIATSAERDLRLLTLEPGHFHAALFQKEMLSGVSDEVHIYAELAPDLSAHLNRLAQYNSRKDNPTHWRVEVHAGPDPLARMLKDKRGDIVILSGNNRGKIQKIQACIDAKLHVMADKPWIIEASDLPALERALESAEKNRIVAYDGMTQRFDTPSLLQKALVNEPRIFGQALKGTDDEPAVYMESVHYLLKEVSGVAMQRPAWFFDVKQQGEALADVGTHLADLVQWTLFPEQAIDYRREIEVLAASRGPTVLSLSQFQKVTGEATFPSYLSADLKEGRLEYYANNRVDYTLRGIYIRLDAKWKFEPGPGEKDTELAIYRGTKSRVELRQGPEEKYRPEIYVLPNRPEDLDSIEQEMRRKVEELKGDWPGLGVEKEQGRVHLLIPDPLRTGHEAHFAMLSRRFLEYVRDPSRVPAWERPNMLAKYYVLTRGVELARKSK